MIDSTQLITSVVSMLIIAVLTTLFNWVKLKTQHSTKKTMGVAIETSNSTWKIIRLSVLDTVIVCFILYMLRGGVVSDEPLTRQAALGISLWASILVSYEFAILVKR